MHLRVAACFSVSICLSAGLSLCLSVFLGVHWHTLACGHAWVRACTFVLVYECMRVNSMHVCARRCKRVYIFTYVSLPHTCICERARAACVPSYNTLCSAMLKHAAPCVLARISCCACSRTVCNDRDPVGLAGRVARTANSKRKAAEPGDEACPIFPLGIARPHVLLQASVRE